MSHVAKFHQCCEVNFSVVNLRFVDDVLFTFGILDPLLLSEGISFPPMFHTSAILVPAQLSKQVFVCPTTSMYFDGIGKGMMTLSVHTNVL